MKQTFAILTFALLAVWLPAQAQAAEGGEELPHLDWQFEGPFGTYDQDKLQRGYLVYRQVCSSCHSMERLYFRNLSGIGYNDAQVKAIAGDFTVTDGPNDRGEMFERPGRPSDRMPSPFDNDAQAKAANGGALPPDMSLIAHARHGGANYIYGLMTGYMEEPPEEFTKNTELLPGQYYNKYMPGHVISMAPPLSDGLVDYPCASEEEASEEGAETVSENSDTSAEEAGEAHGNGEQACAPETVEQYAKDVSAFLQWASDPKMELRKQIGIRAVIFLLLFTLVFFLAKKKLWKKVH